MSDSERSPLLSAEDTSRSSVPASGTSVESTPLLSSPSETPRYDGTSNQQENAGDGASIRSHSSDAPMTKPTRWRWPSIIAMIILAMFSVAIIVVAFFVPAAVEEYAKQAAILEPTSLSLDSITKHGVRAHIQANFRLDGSRVQNDHVRRVGRVATWIVRELGTESTTVKVYLPEYDNILLGSAVIPPLAIRIVDGETTAIDIKADLEPGEAEAIRAIANQWLDGNLDRLRLRGNADIHLKSGIIPLGTHAVSESLTFEAKQVPEMPQYNITKMNFRNAGEHAVAAEVSITAFNSFPIEVDVPPLGFDIYVPNCGLYDPYILVADAVTDPIGVRPRSDVIANVHGLVRELPDSLTRICPNSGSSPLDALLKDYLNGKAATVFVRGKKRPGLDIPDWLEAILASVDVPVPFPGRTFDGLIRNFSLTDTHFTLPDPMADPDDPEANPKVSGNIEVIAGLPSDMNFDINVTNVRASADVFYHKKKLGELDIRHWQAANSTKTSPTKEHDAELRIQSIIKNAPINVTDGDVLSDVIQTLFFGGKDVLLDIKALVDVKIHTPLGDLVLKDLPAEGKIPVKPLAGHGNQGNPITSLQPKVGGIRILDTTPDSIYLQALVNITNPTPYSAHIPYISVHVLCNDSLIGEVTAEDLDVSRGNNTNLVVTMKWDPSLGGTQGKEIGRNMMSQYISGFNTSLTVRTHRDSIPSQPLIGEALSKLNITVATPRLKVPDEGDGNGDSKGHFIRDATFHVVSSTASFTLVSPLEHNTVYIDHINATAFYNHTEAVGKIIYNYPIAASPGASQTPKLPVQWSIGSNGYEKLKQALGGELKLDASAIVSVRIGSWRETVWYVGKGIGAAIRL